MRVELAPFIFESALTPCSSRSFPTCYMPICRLMKEVSALLYLSNLLRHPVLAVAQLRACAHVMRRVDSAVHPFACSSNLLRTSTDSSWTIAWCPSSAAEQSGLNISLKSSRKFGSAHLSSNGLAKDQSAYVIPRRCRHLIVVPFWLL